MRIEIKNKNYAISVIRLVALALVISCHWLEWVATHHNESGVYYLIRILGNYCSVGVQIFLVMSGYLYGLKSFDINESRYTRIYFWKRNIWKILKDYYVHYLFFTIPVVLFVAKEKIEVRALVGAATTWCTFGRELHLWYIPYILFCYLITPSLADIKDSSRRKYITLFVLLAAIEIILVQFDSYFIPAWIAAYIVGFFSSELLCLSKNNINYILIFSWGITIAAYAVKTYFRYYKYKEISILSDNVQFILNEAYNWSQLLLAYCVFMTLLVLLKEWKTPDIICKVLDCFDTYQYDIYICHMMFIKGYLSTVYFTKYALVNVILTVACIGVASYILHMMCSARIAIFSNVAKRE